MTVLKKNDTTNYERFFCLVKEILSDKKVTIAIILLVILSRALQLIYYYNIYVDASYQVMGTQSLLYGHGVSTPNVLANNLSATIYTPLINWPPGYSFLFTPFFYLFNYNYIAAGITIDILSAITLIFICRGILKVLEVPLYLRNLFTLLTGFFIYYFYFNACSDAIGITFILIAVYFTLILIKYKKNIAKNSLCLTFFLFLAALLKYLFMPVIFVVPLFLFLKGRSDGDKKVRNAGLFSFFAITILLCSLLIYQKTVGGSATYISATERGFFPENLLETYPTFPASFLKPDTISLLSTNEPRTKGFIYKLYQVIYVVFLITTILLFCKQLFKQGFKKLTLTQSFYYLIFLLSLAVIILLIVLSLRVGKEEIFSWYLWTYVEDGRYYGLPNVLMHLAIIVIYHNHTNSSRKFLKHAPCFFLLLMIPEMLRGLYFDINRIRNYKKEEYSWQYDNRFQKYASSIINNEKRMNPGKKIIVTGTSYNMNHRVVINSHVPPLTDVQKINSLSTINTKTPVILLAMIQKDSLAAYQPFTIQKNVKTVGNFEGFTFYTAYVTPH